MGLRRVRTSTKRARRGMILDFRKHWVYKYSVAIICLALLGEETRVGMNAIDKVSLRRISTHISAKHQTPVLSKVTRAPRVTEADPKST